MGKKIILVDDEREIAKLLAEILRDEGYDVLVAPNGGAALENVADFGPDLLVSDVMMPLMSGVELLKKVRELPRFKNLPVILMSAIPLKAQREDCGWNYFIRKPFPSSAMLEAIRKTIG